MEAYRSEGRLLNGNELAHFMRRQRIAIWLEEDQQLDPRYLPLLSPNTLVLYAARKPSWDGKPVENERKNGFPSTPIEFSGVMQFGDGSTVLANTTHDYVEQTYTATVPLFKQVEVDGKQVTVIEEVEETRTRTVAVPKVRQSRIAADAFSLFEMGGKRLPPSEIETRLASPQTVVHVAAGQKVSPWYRKLLALDALVLAERKANAR
ncbi:hypothetical protein RSSM_02736 [Rhodopirellula sallentina SM41]|uniref:Uncharacterized protein n=1 Tax=Rhodopirellula sallentina SM41 TaxID=1263870 RepID=M5U2Z0_9BACT|nr:hypothetical protein RSSM_02736 [Rhodopirellula sallentina SM41]